MHKKNPFVKKKRASGDIALQITSMADIFMILLVFLLKNYATSVSNIAPSAHLSLPELTAVKGEVKENLKIEIADDVILIDQQPAVKLQNFTFGPNDDAPGGASQAILNILTNQRKLRPEPNTDSSLIIMADQHAPYATVKRVVASAAGAGFVNLQLVVVDNQ